MPEWASPEELAGGEIPGIDVPEDTFEPIEEPENQPIEEPEQEPDPEIIPEWASPEKLAGGEIPEIDVPEDAFEPIEEPEQEPDPEIIPEWASPEELAGGEIPEIDVPEDTFEPIEEPESQPFEEPIEESDPEIVPEWASPEELAGGEIPEIEVPEGTFEPIEPENQPIEEPEQEPISSPEQESKQEKNYESIDESTTESYSETIQKGNRTLIMADNFSSSYSDIKSFEGTTATEKKREQRKIEKKIPAKTKKTHDQKKDSGSDYKSINRQRSGQSSILVLKPELKSQEKEKETKKKIEKKQLKNENQENEINEAKNEERQEKPKIEKLDEEKDAPKELTNKSSLERRKDTIYFRKVTKKLDDSLKKKAEPKQEKQKEQKNEEKSEFKEDWEILLEKWIKEADEKEISKEIQKELIEKIRKYRKFREIAKRLHQLLEKKILSEKEIRKIKELKKESDNLQDDLFENLRAFRGFYNENIRWYRPLIIAEKEKFIQHLAQKLKNLTKIEKTQKIVKKNWKEILKENLYKNITLSLKEKSIINKILQKEELIEGDKKELISILSKLPTEELISLLGVDFRQHTQNYLRWGWDFDESIKKLMLNNYFLSYNLYKYKKELTEALNFYTINKIKKFPRSARLVISLTIFNKLNENTPLQLRNFVKFLINSLKIKQNKSDWVKKIPNQELHQLSKRLFNKNQIIALELYFIDMIKLINELICEIIRHKKTDDIFSIRSFVSKLVENNINLGLSQRTLLSYISELIDYLNDYSNDFNIEKLSFQTLYDDGKRKECGQCHKIKSYTEFSKRSKNLLQSKCKKCRLEEAAIRNYKKKIRVLLRLLSSISKIKCKDCNTDLSRLSALEFHHNDRKGKKVSFGDIYNNSLDRIIEVLKSENITLLCANCHSKRQVKVFEKFKDIILKNDLFKYTPAEIDRIINNYLKTSPELKQFTPSKISSFKTQIKRWLKKRYIIEQLYDGKCIGCGEINIKNNLPCFDFHHKNENLYEKKSRWIKINKFNIEKIIKILREEDCIALCSNCHRIITHYRFIKHIDEILGKKYEHFKIKAKIIYKNIVNNINNFKFKENEILDPLKKQIEYGEGWKKYIRAIFKLTQEKNDYQFTPNELASFLKLNIISINQYLKKLLRLGLITLFKESERIKVGNKIYGATPRIYKLTDLGLQQFKNLD